MPPPASPPKRRWLRFSLRSFIVAMLLASIGLGWLGMSYQEARRQRAIIAKIETMGGTVVVRGESQWPTFLDTNVLERVVWISFRGSDASDLSPLAELKNLERLDLSNSPVSDLSHLAELKKLERVYVNETQVSDTDVAKLQRSLPNCYIRQ